MTAFLECSTQWRIVPLASGRALVIGLDYAGCKVALEASGIEATPDLWARLCVIENEAVAVVNAKE